MRARPRDLGPAEVAGKAALGSQESLERGNVNWVCVLGGSSRQKGQETWKSEEAEPTGGPER